MMLLWVGAALAGGVHGGIPVRGVPGVGEPSFLTPASGWTASVEGGWVRVFVGATEAEGEEWYARALQSLVVTPPTLDGFDADIAHGDGETLVAFRDGNVGVLVRAERGAGALAATLHAAIVDDVPAPVTPKLTVSEGRWQVDAPGAVHVTFTGGRGVPFKRGAFTEPPRELVAWDAWGRATVLKP